MRAQNLLREWNESEHPREPSGTPEGGQFAGDGSSDMAQAAEGLDPEVIDVGGDTWNKATAIRLEREYQNAKPALEKLVVEAVGQSQLVADEAVDITDVLMDWEDLSGKEQNEIKLSWLDDNNESYFDHEVGMWHDTGQAQEDAGIEVALNFLNHSDNAWVIAAAAKFFTDKEIGEQFPLPKDLLAAIKVKTDPTRFEVTSIKGLDEKYREGLAAAVNEAFNKKAYDFSKIMKEPKSLQESADELAADDWENMKDGDKFKWAEANGYIGAASSLKKQLVSELPKKFDPLSETMGEDYRKTQQLARHLSIVRSERLMMERIKLMGPDFDADSKPGTLALIDAKLWNGWKSASVSTEGKLLQVAAAEELGGRLNIKTKDVIYPDKVKKAADEDYKEIGGYEGVKAYVRAKWEVTQYLLDRAGINRLKLYRGITLYDTDLKPHLDAAKEDHGFKHLPTLEVKRNGAASATISPNVANGWGSSSSHGVLRIVLRADVPRTAVLSVPAYGINMAEEKEVVVTGTAWRGWDAWHDKAPEFRQVPLRMAA